MMKFFLFALLICWLSPSLHRSDNPLIDWSADRKLTWDDFKAPPDKSSPNAALTNTAIKIDFSYNNELFKYHIRCQFDKRNSWGRVKNEYILSHEQGHFDIAEIYARRLNKTLKDYQPRPESLSKDINSVYQEIMHQYHDRQTSYDEETRFSIDSQKQSEWLKKIRDELNQLRDYADYH
jgi:predicted secreted Zn-dependent protease